MKQVYKGRPTRYLGITLSILVIILVSAVTPWSVQVASFTLNANAVTQEILENGDFRDGVTFWNITRHGSATYSLVQSEDSALQMEAAGTPESNITLVHVPNPSAKIVPELAMRIRLRHLGTLTSGNSFIAIITFITWNNVLRVPTRIFIGNFPREVDAVPRSGVILSRTIPSGEWSDIRLQFSRILPDVVSYLQSYTVYKGASVRDDFRVVGLAASVFNGIFIVDSLGLSMISSAKLLINLSSNSLIPMNLLLKSVSVNGTNSFFVISRQALVPFTTFEVVSEILRPVSKGDTYVILLSFETGQVVQITRIVDSAPRWI